MIVLTMNVRFWVCIILFINYVTYDKQNCLAKFYISHRSRVFITKKPDHIKWRVYSLILNYWISIMVQIKSCDIFYQSIGDESTSPNKPFTIVSIAFYPSFSMYFNMLTLLVCTTLFMLREPVLFCRFYGIR